VGIRGLTPYDEKVLGVATLYGLPMLRVRMPQANGASAADGAATDTPGTGGTARGAAPHAGQLRPAEDCPEGLECREVVLAPTYDAPHTVTSGGAVQTYYSIDGGTQVAPGQPIQPLTQISIMLAGATARGVLFEGGRYETLTPFAPALTRIISDTVSGEGERAAQSAGPLNWTPSAWALINSVRTSEGLRQRLVALPAQYRAADGTAGTERLFTEMRYTVYYSQSSDAIPPSIWTVRAGARPDDEAAQVQVDVTDFSGVVRVVVAYTTGDGAWETRSLARAAGETNRWVGLLPKEAGLDYFVQAVDRAGNVAQGDNRGRYFRASLYQHYLPLTEQGE